jgi:hypothetical protein
VDVNVTNPVLPVELSNADPIPVSVANFPAESLIPFSRQCEVADETCTIDLTDLMAMGQVHITQASGQALNVGVTASPRFFNVGIAGPEVLLPAVLNTLDTGGDRDIAFSQSMDLIPVGPEIQFLEPDSTDVYFYIHGHVVGSSAANAANAAAARGATVTEMAGNGSPWRLSAFESGSRKRRSPGRCRGVSMRWAADAAQ